MQLSTHFDLFEFELDGPMPAPVVPTYQKQCQLQLEPIRMQFGKPIVITSGYRDPAANAAAGGVSHSEHEATPEFCASDFRVNGMEADLRPVFDWIRAQPSMPFHQVILEHDPATKTDIVHISLNSGINLFTDREALEGDTGNLTGYTRWDVVPYVESTTS